MLKLTSIRYVDCMVGDTVRILHTDYNADLQRRFFYVERWNIEMLDDGHPGPMYCMPNKGWMSDEQVEQDVPVPPAVAVIPVADVAAHQSQPPHAVEIQSGNSCRISSIGSPAVAYTAESQAGSSSVWISCRGIPAAAPAQEISPAESCCELLHKSCRRDNTPFPRMGTSDSMITDFNLVVDIWRMLSSMDGSLYRDDKVGWDFVQHQMESAHARKSMTFLFMNTNGGYRGAAAWCVTCHALCAVQWSKCSSEDDMRVARADWNAFFLGKYNRPENPQYLSVI